MARAAITLVTLLGARAHGQVSAVEGVLVLRNGNVLSGAVRRLGDDYRIDVAGSTLQVPTEQVEMFAPSLEEAYEARRRDRVGGSADSHVELARWCIQLGMLDEAARELLDARTLDPAHRGAAIVELQLRQKLEVDALRHAPRPAVTQAAPREELPTNGTESDAVDISPAAQIQFVRSIQPMLVRSCATSGCHQPASKREFVIDRWALAGNGNADILRRNLASVHRQVTVDDPPASPLVHWARVTHGRGLNGGSRPLNARQAVILLDWVKQASGVDTVQETPVALADAIEGGAEGVVQASFEEPIADALQFGSDGPRANFRPRDAFDPEVFNRRFTELAEAIDAETPTAESTAEAPSEPTPSEPSSQSPDP